MADFPTLDWEKALVKGLIDKGNDNALLKGDGAREKAMANLAEPIAEAIKNGGGGVHWIGSFTVAELNSMENPEKDGIYGVKDSGVIVNKDGSRIEVSANDAIVWNGEKWASFIDIDLDFGGWLGNMTVAEINALTGLKKGDSVTVKDSGIVEPGHVTVSMGDDLMWVASKSEWVKKIVSDKGFVVIGEELSFG